MAKRARAAAEISNGRMEIYPENSQCSNWQRPIKFPLVSRNPMVRNMSDSAIRPAHAADAHLIVALLRELAGYEKLLDGFTLNEDAVRRDMLGDACRCELAFAGGEPVGIATWFWTYSRFGAARGLFVEDLFVRPAFRGRGLGRALLAHLAAIAVEADAFLAWQVLDWNAPSIAFYKSLGAAPRENWIDYRLKGEALKRLPHLGKKV